jgi:hypothetical protein
VLIDRALRDEGTSYHYLPPSTFAEADTGLADRAFAAASTLPVPAHREGDFEKGADDGARDSLALIAAAARGCGFGEIGSS